MTALVLSLPVASLGQTSVAITEVSNLTSTPVAGSGHDYLTDLSEIVSPANGSLSIRIAAPTPHERRPVLPTYAYTYDTNGQFVMTFNAITQQLNQSTQYEEIVEGPYLQTPYVSGGYYASFGAGSLSFQKTHFSYCTNPTSGGGCALQYNCTLLSGFTATDPSGGRHALGVSFEIRGGFPSPENCPDVGIYTYNAGGDEQYKIDTTCYSGCYTWPTSTAVVDLHGEAFNLLSGIMEDTNGNNLNTDGRTWTFPYSYVYEPGYVMPTSMTFPGFSAYTYGAQAGGTGTATLHYQLRFNSFASTYPSDCNFNANNNGNNPIKGLGGASYVALPNGQRYSFTYDPTYGYVKTITYPTGATVNYTWGTNLQSEVAGFKGNDTVARPVVNTAPECIYSIDTPAVTKRVVSYDGVTSAQEQDFAYSTTWNTNYSTWGYQKPWTKKTTTVTTIDLMRPGQPRFKTVYTYIPMSTASQVVGTSTTFPVPILPVESTIAYYDTSGALLRTVTKMWNTPNQLAAECTTLDNGQTSGVFYQYAPYSWGSISSVAGGTSQAGSTNLATDRAEYDYGAVTSTCQKPTSTPIRETTTAYASLGHTPFWQHAPALVDRPSTIQTYGNGTLLAETDFAYDGTAPVAATPAPYGHDEANYGPSASTTWARGNITTITKKCFVGSTSCTNSVWNIAYDTTGVPVSVTDAKGNITAISYADNFAGGNPSQSTNEYVTKITKPATNGVSHIETFQWNYNQGELAVSTDENGKQSFFYYNDPWNRPTEEDYPDGGGIKHIYNDSAPVSVTTCHNINGSASATCSSVTPPTGWKVDLSLKDGVGHVTQTQLISDSEGPDYTDMSYDGIGRVYTRSNPYRSTTSATDGITTYTYDALGRTTTIAQADGSSVITSYSGNQTTVADEAGSQRTNTVDALGRITQVLEDPGASPHLDYETDYNYDALSNLLGVTQKGGTTTSSLWRNRAFTYDSLSRLLTANNPESGTITYSYDANGNLSAKTAPAPNQIGAATVTTSYSFDGLNRLTQKSYSDGTTPSAVYNYDQAAPWGWNLSNYIGRLTTQSSGAVANLFNYDPMGRVTLGEQCQPQNCSTAPSFFTAYTYDFYGDLTRLEMGQSGTFDVTVSYNYDSAARPTQVTSNLVDSQHPATLFTVDPSVGYFPSGILRKATFGNGLVETNVYNNRLQPCLLDLVNSSSVTLQTCNDGTPSGNVLDLWMGYGTTNNNGNILNWNATGVQSFVRTYGYDSLNRISTMSDTVSSQNCKGLQWTYDAWANRIGQATTSGSCFAFNNTADTQNRLIGYQYDAAGNMTNDGTHSYTYDAENRIISVDGGATSYIYDADGRRAEKSGWSDYIHDSSGNTVAQVDPAGWQVGYVYLGSSLIAQYDNSTTHFVHSDHLGSTRLLTTISGATFDSLDYQPFGEQTWGDTGTTHKFTGKERDTESGLDYFKARYYGSGLGRFITPDWSDRIEAVPYADLGNPQSLNLYAYVKNNPIAFSDPDGHCTDDAGVTRGWVWCLFHETKQHREERIAAEDAAFRRWQASHPGGTRGDYLLWVLNIQLSILPGVGGLDVAGGEVVAEGATLARGGLGPVLKGAAGVAKATAEIEAEGGEVVAREVTVETSAGRARVDLVYRDAEGQLVFAEAKNGPTAAFNPNQARVYEALKNGGGTLVGGNAQAANLPTAVGPTAVRVFKY